MSDPGNPMSAAQRLARPDSPRRLYDEVTVAPHKAGFAVLLDGRGAKTPGRNVLTLPTAELAAAVAAEWRAQGERLDPSSMPLTRLANAAIDRVAGEMTAVRSDIVKYAGSDLICYRAEGPAALVTAQGARWSPLVAWAQQRLGVPLRLAVGVVHVAQDPKVIDAVAQAIATYAPLRLAALHIATTLTGSAVIALALAEGRLTPDEAWTAAQVDEDWQMSQWGADEMALAARAQRRRDFDAAAMVLGAQ